MLKSRVCFTCGKRKKGEEFSFDTRRIVKGLARVQCTKCRNRLPRFKVQKGSDYASGNKTGWTMPVQWIRRNQWGEL